jgi:YD repeat-containing protein
VTAHCQTLTTTSAQGVVTAFAYDAHNNVTQVTEGGATTKSAFDSSGYLAAITTPTGVTTNYTYDANGNPTGSSLTWVNPANPAQSQVVTTGAVFDANDRRTQSIDVYGHASVSKYDLKGRVIETDDLLGNATKYVYDAADNVIQIAYPPDPNYPQGTVSETVYDPEGRPTYTDDRHAPGQADVHGTHTIYDSMGRVIETDRLDNLVISVTSSNGIFNSQWVSNGAVLSTTTSTYNDLGQLTSSTDAAHHTTQYQYDAAAKVQEYLAGSFRALRGAGRYRVVLRFSADANGRSPP